MRRASPASTSRAWSLPTARPGLPEHVAGALVHDDLPLDPLQGVVDRLRVHAQLIGHVLVRGALEVEPERVRLESRETCAEAEDEALQLLARDHLHGGLVDVGAR